MESPSGDPHPAPHIEFAGFVLDGERREIVFDGQTLDANDRTYEFLKQLALARGALVGKNELIDTLWPDQFVTDASLSRLVSDTRALLAQHRPDELIQTVRGRGFRLKAEVRVGAEPIAVSHEPDRPGRRWPWVAAVVVALAGGFFWWLDTRDAPAFAIDGSILVMPVEVSTQDDRDSWVRYGVMAMLTQQLQSYDSLAVMGAQSVISGLTQIGYEGTTDADPFPTVCGALGCKQLVSVELQLEDEQLVLQYRLHRQNQRSPVYRFVSNDALDAAQMLSEHLVARLVPRSRERLDLKPFYTDDPIANRNLALGISSLYHADYSEARAYLNLALRRKPEFFWNRLFAADVLLRMGEYEEAQAFLEESQAGSYTTLETYERERLRSNLLYAMGELEASQQVSRALMPIAERMADREGIGVIEMNIGTTYTALGDTAAARAHLERAIAHFATHGFSLREAQARFNLANVLRIEDADPGEVADLYQEAATAFLNVNAENYLTYALTGLANSNRMRGRFDDALAQYDRIIEIATATGDAEGLLHVQIDLAMLHVDRGDLDAAESHARRAYTGAGTQFSYMRSYSAAVLSQILIKQRRFEEVPTLLTEIESVEWFDPRPSFALLPASFAHASGDFAVAVERAEAMRERLGDDWTALHQRFLELYETSQETGRVIPFDYIKGIPAD